MSISGFIQRTKGKVLNKVEQQKNARYSERLKRTEELKIKNAVAREDMKVRSAYEKAKAEDKKLRKEKFKNNLASFGINPSSNRPRASSRSITGFKSPFSGGLGGNSPFSPGNLAKDKNSSPFSGNMFGSEPVRKKKTKKMKGKTIVINLK